MESLSERSIHTHLRIPDFVRLVAGTQDYRSTIYHDRGTKTLGLVKAEGVWKIVHERWRP